MSESKPKRDMPRQGRSLLSVPQRVLVWIGLVMAGFMVANTAYLQFNRLADKMDWRLFADSTTSLPKILQVTILSHTGVGLLMAAILLVFSLWHLRMNWVRRKPRSITTGVGVVVSGLVLAVSGLFIMTEANSRENAWIWWTHAACGFGVVLFYLAHRWTSVVKPTRAAVRVLSTLTVLLAVGLLSGHTLSHRGLQLTREAVLARESGKHLGPGSRERVIADFAQTEFVPAAFVPAGSPFFPSAATTTTGDYLPSRIITQGNLPTKEELAPDLEEYGFVVNTQLGARQCVRCHADSVEQWSRSAHRFASFNNPFYEATINDLREKAVVPNKWVESHIGFFPETRDRVALIKSKWCSGCHDPSLMLAGLMNHPIDRATPQAQAGLTCLACHAIDKIHNNTGNGNYNIADEQEDPYVFSEAEDGLGAFLHDTALKAKPNVHKAQMLKPFFRDAEFCAACHKVSLDVPLNNYRWLRAQDEYDGWHDSGTAHNAARTFYLPPSPKKCQDCHMPYEPAPLGDVSAKNGMIRSHRFLAVNTALPFIRGDQETIERIEQFLEGKMRVDIFAVRRPDDSEPIMAPNRSKPVLTAGETVQFDVVVRNQGVGHTFPGGTNDSNEGWLEIVLSDEVGNVLSTIGGVQANGHVDPNAHFYRAIILDKDGNMINRRNAQDIHTAAYVRVVGPGTADVARFKIFIPPQMAGHEVKLQARLLWRKFERHYTEFAYRTNPQGFKRFDDVPDLPVTQLAEDVVQFAVLAPEDQKPQTPTIALPEDWVRFNDYGIGSVLQGDTRTAQTAFGHVASVVPERIDGPRNLARVAIRDGSLAEAYRVLRECENLAPGDPQTAFFWGVALQEDGRYAEAAAAYRRVLERFPGDRAAWNNLGRTLYLQGEYEAALTAFDEVLKIDPESSAAHYHRILIFKAMGRPEDARIAEAAYEKYQIDESAQEITLAYRRANDADNLEAQAVHVHDVPSTSAEMSDRVAEAPANEPDQSRNQ